MLCLIYVVRFLTLILAFSFYIFTKIVIHQHIVPLTDVIKLLSKCSIPLTNIQWDPLQYATDYKMVATGNDTNGTALYQKASTNRLVHGDLCTGIRQDLKYMNTMEWGCLALGLNSGSWFNAITVRNRENRHEDGIHWSKPVRRLAIM